jgi:hypothetical protein
MVGQEEEINEVSLQSSNTTRPHLSAWRRHNASTASIRDRPDRPSFPRGSIVNAPIASAAPRAAMMSPASPTRLTQLVARLSPPD